MAIPKRFGYTFGTLSDYDKAVQRAMEEQTALPGDLTRFREQLHEAKRLLAIAELEAVSAALSMGGIPDADRAVAIAAKYAWEMLDQAGVQGDRATSESWQVYVDGLRRRPNQIYDASSCGSFAINGVFGSVQDLIVRALIELENCGTRPRKMIFGREVFYSLLRAMQGQSINFNDVYVYGVSAQANQSVPDDEIVILDEEAGDDPDKWVARLSGWTA